MNKRIAVIIVIAFAVVLALYLIVFRYGLSHSTTTWSEFGGYVSGVLMPILTAINIYVFVKLTNAISEKDSQRSKKEMLFQKQLMLMQFRKKEIDEFETMMNSIYTIDDIKSTDDMISKISNLVIYLGSFRSTKLSLFGCDEDSEISKEINKLIDLLSEINKNWNNNGAVPGEYMLSYYKYKNSITRSLQNITINC